MYLDPRYQKYKMFICLHVLFFMLFDIIFLSIEKKTSKFKGENKMYFFYFEK